MNFSPHFVSAFGAALAFIWSGLVPARAQQATVPLTPADIAARRQSVVNLESHIAQRQERMGQIMADVRSLDDRVEKSVDQIVTMLEQIKDSEESKVRIATVKADVITALRRSIDYYDNHRDVIKEQLRTGKTEMPKETLEKDLAIFDARIDKRVDQIAALAKSFTDPQELEKYEVTSRNSWYGWSYENEEISEAWKQNRRESRHTESAREGVSEGLRDSIDHLTQRNTDLAGKLKDATLSDIEREYYQSEIARNGGLIEHRSKQLEDLSTGSTPETQSVLSHEAHETDMLVQSARNDIREDFFTLFRKYTELNRARAELKQLQDNLAARIEWLKDYDSKQ